VIGPDLLERAIERAGLVRPSPDIQAEINAAARWPVSDEMRAGRAEQDRIARAFGYANAAERARHRQYEYDAHFLDNEAMRKKNEQKTKDV
jgi:hypothetical protein